jgi:hypothetical protein
MQSGLHWNLQCGRGVSRVAPGAGRRMPRGSRKRANDTVERVDLWAKLSRKAINNPIEKSVSTPMPCWVRSVRYFFALLKRPGR